MPLQKAFVWAAGLGTRLRPYTHETPKPLLPLFGRPLLEYVLRYLAHAGVRDVTANVWHLAEQFEPLPGRAAAFGVDLELSRQPQRFEHGGDLAFARDFLRRLGDDEPFLGLNGDTLFYLPPERLHRAAERVSAEAPVLLFTRETEASPLRLRDGRVVGVGDVRYEEAAPTGRADDFGIRVFHASVRDFLVEPPQTDAMHGRSGLLGRITAAGKCVLTEPAPDADREEVGTVEDYEGHERDAALRALTDKLAALP